MVHYDYLQHITNKISFYKFYMVHYDYLIYKIAIVYHEKFIKRIFFQILMEKHSFHKYFWAV